MGSGAFLVEACRQLGDELVKAWHAHDCVPTIPPDEDELLHARRIVAQRCLYGVDKNPMAVDLAKLSLWLATLAKDHPFTFLDHALRHGDSLVGLIEEADRGVPLEARAAAGLLARGHRGSHQPGDEAIAARSARRPRRRPRRLLSQKLALADEALNPLRFYGDLVIAAFFAGSNDRQRRPGSMSQPSNSAPICTTPITSSFARRWTKQDARCSKGKSRFIRSIGRSSFPKCSTGRVRGLMRL